MDALGDHVGAGPVSVSRTSAELTTLLLPLLGRSLHVGFNVFDVMHHGTHEKQLSNVFRWLFEIGGTHEFGDLGQRLFVEEINRRRGLGPALPLEPYTVGQEVNTAAVDATADIADLVLESDTARIVVENYGISDPHQHGYDNYRRLAERDGKTGVVVMLCVEEDLLRMTDGWQAATVVTYERILDRLMAELSRDGTYATQHPEQYAFISQLHRKYASGKERVSSNEVLDFVVAMCATGEAGRYQRQNQELAAEQFATALADQARARFSEGRDVLQVVKARLRTYADSVLRTQLGDALGQGPVVTVSANYVGIYQWTVNFEAAPSQEVAGEVRLQIKFGPSAWHANEQDRDWKQTVDRETADYAHLFVTNAQTLEIRQSSVTMQDVLEGLAPTDTRLRDELIGLM